MKERIHPKRRVTFPNKTKKDFIKQLACSWFLLSLHFRPCPVVVIICIRAAILSAVDHCSGWYLVFLLQSPSPTCPSRPVACHSSFPLLQEGSRCLLSSHTPLFCLFSSVPGPLLGAAISSACFSLRP